MRISPEVKPSGIPHPRVYDATVAIIGMFYTFHTISVSGATQRAETAELLVGSHRSSSDIPALAITNKHWGRRTSFITKEEYSEIPVIGSFMSACGAIYVNRAKPAPSTSKRAIDALRQNSDDIAIFLEGSILSSNTVDVANEGPAQFSLRSGAIIRPVGIAGGEKRPKLAIPTNLHVHYAETINPLDYVNTNSTPKEQRQELTPYIQEAVNNALQTARAEHSMRYGSTY